MNAKKMKAKLKVIKTFLHKIIKILKTTLFSKILIKVNQK